MMIVMMMLMIVMMMLMIVMMMLMIVKMMMMMMMMMMALLVTITFKSQCKISDLCSVFKPNATPRHILNCSSNVNFRLRTKSCSDPFSHSSVTMPRPRGPGSKPYTTTTYGDFTFAASSASFFNADSS